MLTEINPKLPMRDKAVTKDFYVNKLEFQLFGDNDFDGYLMVHKDNIQIHLDKFISGQTTLINFTKHFWKTKFQFTRTDI